MDCGCKIEWERTFADNGVGVRGVPSLCHRHSESNVAALESALQRSEEQNKTLREALEGLKRGRMADSCWCEPAKTFGKHMAFCDRARAALLEEK